MGTFVDKVRPYRWAFVVALVAGGVTLLGALGSWRTGWLGVWDFEPRFADTYAILAASDAHAAGLNVYDLNPLDPLKRPHVYGPGWLLAAEFGLTRADTDWLGALLAVLFIGTAAAVMKPSRLRDIWPALLLLVSPPVMLGINRGNNDLVVFLLLAISAWALATRRTDVRWFGFGAIGLATVLKFYPIVAVAAGLLRPPSGTGWRRLAFPIGGAAFTGLVAGGVLWASWSDVRLAIAAAPSPATIFAYGFDIAALCWTTFPQRWALVVGWCVGVGSVAMLLRRHTRELLMPLAAGTSGIGFAAGATTWIFCYFLIRSFPYRFVLLLFVAAYWLRAAAEACSAARRQLWLWIIVAWIDLVKGFAGPTAAVDKAGELATWAPLNVVVGIEQGMILVLTLALALTVGSTLWHVLRGRGADATAASAG